MKEDLHNKVVKQFEKLNLGYNKELQDVLTFASKLCKSSASFISFFDKEVQLLWVKNEQGFKISEAELSFCNHTSRRNSLYVVNDTLLDSHYCSHPSVLGSAKVRFYGAAPLITHDGTTIGMLCVMDNKPHLLTTQEKLIFKILAKHAISVMELKLNLDKLDKNFNALKRERKTRLSNEIRLRAMFESLTDAYFLLGRKGEVIDFNRAAYTFILEMYNLKLSYGVILREILPPAFQEAFTYHMINALNGKKKHLEALADFGPKGKIWLDSVFEPVKNNSGDVMGVSYVSRDITERKLNEEKIVRQNQILARIAEIQSHDYRGPVASILGLMSLIEGDNYEASKDYLVMLQTAVKRLDEKIHEVVNMVSNF